MPPSPEYPLAPRRPRLADRDYGHVNKKKLVVIILVGLLILMLMALLIVPAMTAG
jgi:hypothetical protein